MNRYIFLASLCIFMWGCFSSEPAKPLEHVSITTVIDPSDRLDPSRCDYQDVWDRHLIAEAFHFFNQDVKRKLYIASLASFKLSLFEQASTPDVGWVLSYFNIRLAETPFNMRKAAVDTVVADFGPALCALYSQLMSAPTFTGADVYSFFKYDLRPPKPDSLSTHREIVLLLTDGYIVSETNLYQDGPQANYIPPAVLNRLRNMPNWEEIYEREGYGILPTGRSFEGVEVVVAGINPKPYFNEYDILVRFWSDWLESMGITRYTFIRTGDDPQAAQDQLYDFLTGS